MLKDVYNAPAKRYFGDLFYYGNSDDWIIYAYIAAVGFLFLITLYYIFNVRKGG